MVEPGDLDGREAGLLCVGEQGLSGAQQAAGLVERIVSAAAFAGQFALDALPAGCC